MLLSNLGLLALALRVCHASPVVQITLHDVPLLSLTPESVAPPPGKNWTLSDALKLVDGLQKNATVVANQANKVGKLPDDKAPEDEFNKWLDDYTMLQNLMKNQTAAMKNLWDDIYYNIEKGLPTVDDTVKLSTSIGKLIDGLNQTEFDPLVQLSSKLENTIFRHLFYDGRYGLPGGGLVGFTGAWSNAIQALSIVFSDAPDKDYPKDFWDKWDEYMGELSWDLGDFEYSFQKGHWELEPRGLLNGRTAGDMLRTRMGL